MKEYNLKLNEDQLKVLLNAVNRIEQLDMYDCSSELNEEIKKKKVDRLEKEMDLSALLLSLKGYTLEKC